jgi:hypothetical protein
MCGHPVFCQDQRGVDLIDRAMQGTRRFHIEARQETFDARYATAQAKMRAPADSAACAVRSVTRTYLSSRCPLEALRNQPFDEYARPLKARATTRTMPRKRASGLPALTSGCACVICRNRTGDQQPGQPGRTAFDVDLFPPPSWLPSSYVSRGAIGTNLAECRFAYSRHVRTATLAVPSLCIGRQSFCPRSDARCPQGWPAP